MSNIHFTKLTEPTAEVVAALNKWENDPGLNTNAIKLYQKLAYQEIGRVEAFTYWQGTLWQDIRMEKYLPV